MEDYQHHIRNAHADHAGEAICGAKLTGMEWAFVDVDHAFHSTPRDRVQPCPACAAKVIEVFQSAE